MNFRNLFRKPVFPQFESWLDRRTVDAFARQLSGLDKLDPAARQVFESALLPDEAIQILIYAPFQGLIDASGRKRSRFWGWVIPWRFSSTWILALTPTHLLLARPVEVAKKPELMCIPLESLLYLQSGKILLFSWMTLYWVEQGQVRQESVYFNTVCEKMFQSLSEAVRGYWFPESRLAVMEQNLRVLDGLPFKFMNMIPLYLLLPGEALEDIIYRPAQWTRRLGLFRVMALPRMAIMRTNGHIILAEEDLSDREGSYGWITTFLPCPAIQSMRCAAAGKEVHLKLSLCHQGAVKEVVVRFPAGMEQAVRAWLANRAEVSPSY